MNTTRRVWPPITEGPQLKSLVWDSPPASTYTTTLVTSLPNLLRFFYSKREGINSQFIQGVF